MKTTTKLRTVHKVSGIGGTVTRDTTDYLGNLVMRNRHLGMYRFDGGYVSFNNDTIDGWHYYIQDYMGNNRLVVRDSIIEQITHYYPYGGVIGDISTNENVQKYKFEGPRSHQKEIDNLLARRRAFRRGVELDRTFGLDNYDIHARQYFAMAPMWDKPDSKAEDYYPISPYAYCGGDPVNNGDYNGEKIIFINGKIGGGSPPSGAEYWNGEHSSFVLQAQAVLNDNSVVFSTEDYGYLSTAEERRQQGYKYAKSNFEEWASNMNTDETFKLVSHSMGGAFSMGIEDYIKEQGREVEVNAMINTYQVDHIDIDATSSTVYIDYQNKNDPVLFWFDDNLGYGKLNNADIIIRESSNAKLLYIHRSPIDSGNFWETVRQCLNQK